MLTLSKPLKACALLDPGVSPNCKAFRHLFCVSFFASFSPVLARIDVSKLFQQAKLDFLRKRVSPTQMSGVDNLYRGEIYDGNLPEKLHKINRLRYWHDSCCY